jgi:beta-glucosidase
LEAAEAKQASAPRRAGGFPAGFVWGTATSSYQVEGAVNGVVFHFFAKRVSGTAH